MAIHPKMEAVEHLLRQMIMRGEYSNFPYTYHPQVIRNAQIPLESSVLLPTTPYTEVMKIVFWYSERMNNILYRYQLDIIQYTNGEINVSNHDLPHRHFYVHPRIEIITDNRENTTQFMKRFKEWLDIPRILYDNHEYWINFNAERNALLNQETVLFPRLSPDVHQKIIQHSQIYPPANGVQGLEEALLSTSS